MSRQSGRGKWTRRFSFARSHSHDPVNMTPNGDGHAAGEEEPTDARTIRITVVGDGHTGKTCLLIGYKDKVYNDVYIPTVFDSYSMNIPINSKTYRLILQDTAGQEDYDKLRPLGYPRTDAFIICYAVDRKDSHANVAQKWAREVRHYRPKCKIILAATKVDMRNLIENCLTVQDGLDLQEKIRADDFLECSAKELFNIDAIFNAALMACLAPKMKSAKRQCTLL